MIVKLKGFIEDWFEDFVDLDVKGVVYRIFVPKKNINKILKLYLLSNLNSNVKYDKKGFWIIWCWRLWQGDN